ncbi:hypothetical protein Bca4012_016936 [Brassica carinata]
MLPGNSVPNQVTYAVVFLTFSPMEKVTCRKLNTEVKKAVELWHLMMEVGRDVKQQEERCDCALTVRKRDVQIEKNQMAELRKESDFLSPGLIPSDVKGSRYNEGAAKNVSNFIKADQTSSKLLMRVETLTPWLV